MLSIRETSTFTDWMENLCDDRAQARIARRIDRLAAGNPGDVKPVGEGVSELRIDYGPGYRVYFLRRGATLIILLCGGDKRTQARDVVNAKRLARSWKDEGWL
jgi:putative addiction module killer protein